MQRVTYNSTAVFTSAHDREREVGPLNKVATMRAFSQPLAMATMLLVGAFASSPVLAEYAIPEQDDWVEQGVALTAGSEGTWDVRFYGQISPGTVLKKDGTYFLYYVGADGDRSTDGGPRNRALGVATSTDGLNFTKHACNPVITHLPQNNEEEGVFSAGATVNPDGTVVLHYGAIWAANPTTESVHGFVAQATSSNGLDFTDQGYVVAWDDPAVWGSGDELAALGTLRANDKWAVYYIAKGNEASWDLGVATGNGPGSLGQTSPVLTSHNIIGGADPIWLSNDKFALFVVKDFEANIIDVHTASPANPAQLSPPVKTYAMFPPRYRHTTVYLDQETDTWFMYQSTDRQEDGNHIVVRTAPAKDDQVQPPQDDYEVGPEEIAGSFSGSRPTIAVDSQNQPHIVVDKDWSDVLHIYHKLNGNWSEALFAQGNFGSDRNYLPHMEIDPNDRAWISSWYATKNVEDECGQGVWLLDSVSTAPAQVFHEKIYITWSNGNLSLDPHFPDECVVMGREGSWQKVNTSGAVFDSGQMFPGISGEKLRFLVSPGQGEPGVWHAIQSGYNKSASSYQNSVRHAAGQQPAVWAGYEAYPEQGEDLLHPGLGIDWENPQAAYIAIRYNPGVVINVWNGTQMVYDPANLPVIDAATAKDGNGVDRFGPQWAPAVGGGAYLCWSGGDGWVKLKKIEADGSIGPGKSIAQGSGCAMATDSEGSIHMAYVNGGMRYRKISPNQGEKPPEDAEPPQFFDFAPLATAQLEPDCSVTAQDSGTGLDPGAAVYTYSTDSGTTWHVQAGSGSNVALDQPCQASSEFQFDDRKKEYANDGNPDSQWAPLDGATEFWWSVDFGAEKAIEKIRMVTLGTTDRGKDYHLDFWDGGGWQVIVAGTKTTQIVEHTFDPVTTQKVRVFFSSTYGNEESFQEIEVYEVGGESMVPDPTGLAWLPAECDGQNGDGQATLFAPAVPFHQRSDTANHIQFKIADMAGNVGTSSVYAVVISSEVTPVPDSGADVLYIREDVRINAGTDRGEGDNDGRGMIVLDGEDSQPKDSGGCNSGDPAHRSAGTAVLLALLGALLVLRKTARRYVEAPTCLSPSRKLRIWDNDEACTRSKRPTDSRRSMRTGPSRELHRVGYRRTWD